MNIKDILSPSAVLVRTDMSGKKNVLDVLSAAAAAKTGLDKQVILDALIERERLGTTGVGRGVALPHTRLGSLKKIFCAFIKMNPVDFDAVDEKPVDLAFLLLVPEKDGADHLKALAHLSRLLRNEKVTESLRQAESPELLFKTIIENDTDE